MKINYIEFKKKRELGDILSDSFAFFKNQFKPLLSTFFKIVGPYLLTILIFLSFFLYTLNPIFDFNIESLNETYSIFLIVILASVIFILAITSGVMTQSSILYFIESYIDNKGKTNFLEIKKKVYQNFWNFLGLGFLVALSIGVGFIFCIIPGIYLYVPLSLTFAIYIFSKKKVKSSYSYSFTLIKDEWWITFITIFVIGIIISIAGFAFSMPATIYNLTKVGISASEYGTIASEFALYKDPIYLILYIIAFIARFILNIITIIANALIYFNLNEKKNLSGTYERIQNLGQNLEK